MSDPGQNYSPRPALEPSDYSKWIRVNPSAQGYLLVRSRLVFIAGDFRNVIGQIESGTVIRAAGPMKNSTGSMGIGYSIRLRDPSGATCQGFVSATAVEVVR